MRKAFLVLVFVFSCGLSFGQKIRFSDSSNVWSIYVLTCCNPPSFTPEGSHWSWPYTGSSVIGGHKYYQLMGSYIREDTVLNKVYIRYHSDCLGDIDTVEKVLYDYNWHIGDTVRQPSICGFAPICWVIGIDSTKISAIWYKIWHFNGSYFGTGTDLDYHVIEGLGCTNKFDFAIKPYPYFEHSEQLFCFSNAGISPTLSHSVPSWGLLGDINFDNSSTCLLPLKSSESHKQSDFVVIHPNPIDNTSKIILPYNISSGKLIILNSIGQTIVNEAIQNKNEIQIGDKIKVPGMYYFRVTDNEAGKAYSGKFVAQ
jgi:hypothetical protein